MVEKKVAVPRKVAAKQPEPKLQEGLAAVAENPAHKRRELVGIVVSDKMTKTISVAVTRQVRHRLYKKYFSRSRKFKAHDENGLAKMGDLVQIVESRPLSKTKRWALKSVLRKDARLLGTLDVLKEQV